MKSFSPFFSLSLLLSLYAAAKTKKRGKRCFFSSGGLLFVFVFCKKNEIFRHSLLSKKKRAPGLSLLLPLSLSLSLSLSLISLCFISPPPNE